MTVLETWLNCCSQNWRSRSYLFDWASSKASPSPPGGPRLFRSGGTTGQYVDGSHSTPNSARTLRSPTFGSSVQLLYSLMTTVHGIERQSLHRYSFGILCIAWLQGNEVSIIRYLRCRYKSTFEANQIHPEPQLAQVLTYIGGIAGELCDIVLF